MEESAHSCDLNLGNYGVDEEFKSCCEEDEDWQDAEEFLPEGREEGNEEIPLGIYQGQEEGDQSSLRISELLQDDVEASVRLLMEFGENLESINFSDAVVPLPLISPSKVHDEDLLQCSLRPCEGYEVVVSVSSLGLPEDHEEDISECSLRLPEEEEEGGLDCELRLSKYQVDDTPESSIRLCEAYGSDVSECSSQVTEADEDVSECSLIFSEDHEDDIVGCSMTLLENCEEDDDELLVRVFSKGVSASENCGSGCRISGIGVVMEKPQGVPFLQVQKKLDFFVEELIAEHLALMDSLLEALRNGCCKVLVFTDSKEVYRSITRCDAVEDQFLLALRERIQELADKFESFVIRLAPRSELKKPLQLAQEATGIPCLIECSACGEDKQPSKMIEMDCSHDLCFDCMGIYVKSKVPSSRGPVKCPQLRCKQYISNSVCRSFLPSASFQSLEGALTETESRRSLWRFYCPFPDCSMLLRAHHLSSSPEPSLIQSDMYCIECPECCRLVCSRCQVPWHSSMRCEEYENSPLDERINGDFTLHQLARGNSWRRCGQCRQMLDLVEGCHQRVSCRCGHEFCFTCGAEYRYGAQTCQCEFHDENSESSPAPSGHDAELWRWDCFNPLPSTIDGYTEQEKTQLALIQRFLAGGISLDNHNPSQSPPRSSDSYLDTIKDLNQLPWLESFISVIGDSYQEDHIY